MGRFGERTDDGIADLAKFAARLHESTILWFSRGSNWDHLGAILGPSRGHLVHIDHLGVILGLSDVISVLRLLKTDDA